MKFLEEMVGKVSDNNEGIDAKQNITKLSAEIKRYQDKIKTYIDTNHVDFLPNLSSNEMYLEEGEKLVREVEDLLQTIENDTKHGLYSATEELRQNVEELNEVAIGLRTSCKILTIDKLFESLEAAKSNCEYLIVMDITSKLKSLLDDPNDKILSRLDCYQNIRIKYHIESEMLLHNLKQCFEQMVQFDEKLFQNTKSVKLKISKNENQLHDTIVALFNAKYNPKKQCEFLIDNCFEPIVTKPVSMEFRDDLYPDYIQLSLSYSLKDLGDNLRPNYKIVFKNIEMILLCLGHINVQISEKMSVLSVFGEQIKEKLMNLLINECLINSIPETMDDMTESTLVEDILKFNSFLYESQLLNEDTDKDLIKYANKIGLLFRNRFCMVILDSAVVIMRKDLHDMILIAENNTGEEVANNPFLFPRCMVSKSVMELIGVMEKVLKQALTADEEISTRLLSTISIILNRYLIEVPSHHEKLLHNIPQQTALFHNNCMFLAHWVTKNSDKGIELFQTIEKSLQSLGSDHFSYQVKNQKAQLLEILKGFDLEDAISELGIGPQKVVRQCLRQLDLLKNVWQTILPDVVYKKTMSSLLNDFCSEIIKRIMALEDLPSTISSELVEIISIIIDRAPTIFQDQQEVVQVKTWMKLTQLKMILGSSLIQITDQWSDGKGPLTLNYKADEIKHLIRALFQNTDRRANALASIL